MMYDEKKYQKYKNMTIKENACFIFTISNPVLNKNDPIHKLISNFNEIKLIYNSNLKEYKKFLYFNKENIHKILYDLEEILKIDDKEEIKLSELFYFSLLLVDNPVLIKYEISINYIRKIYKLIKESKNNTLAKIILSKIIFILIYNFKGQNDYNENDYDNEIEIIEKECISIVNNNLKKLNFDINIEDYMIQKIDFIYMKIIISLIKLNDFDKYDYYEKLIKILDLESINITQTIFEGISEELDNEKNIYFNEYKIDKFDDLKNEKIINFYYILLKYILKSSLYVYRIKLLDLNRRNLLKLLKQNLAEIIKLCDEKGNENKIEYIINNLTNSDIYLVYKNKINEMSKNEDLDKAIADISSTSDKNDVNISNNNNLNQKNDDNMGQNNNINQTNTYFGNFTYNKDISFYENNEISSFVKLEIDKDIAMSLLQRSRIIIEKHRSNIDMTLFYGDNFKENLKYDNLCQNADYDKFFKQEEKNEDTEIIYKNYKKFLIFLNEIEEYLKKSKIQFNPKIKLELRRKNPNVNKNSQKSNENNDIYTIDCDYIFINKFKGNEELRYYDRNILINGIHGNISGFILLINELRDEDYIAIKENSCYIFSISNPVLNKNDPIHKLISNFDEINLIHNSNLKEYKKFLYFNKKNINEILYKSKKFLKIDDKEEIKLSELFYFSLYIDENPVLNKYEISINYIKKINKLIEENEDNIFKKLILSKIVMILIYNFKSQNNYDTEIGKIEEGCLTIIKENLEGLNLDVDYEKYMSKKLDFIYLKIIISIIKSEDSNKHIDIIKELDLESINITQTIFNGISEELDDEKNIYFNEYKIEKLDDLKNEKIINFYYILLKYILKNTLYVYRIKLLDLNRRNLLKLLKQNLSEIKKLCEGEENGNEIEYIINNMTNSKYYLKIKSIRNE